MMIAMPRAKSIEAPLACATRNAINQPIDGAGVPAGLDADPPGTKVFHAGTALDGERVLTAGGRVLCVCALGDSVREAQRAAYERAARIEWRDCFYRRDIGHRAVARESAADRG